MKIKHKRGDFFASFAQTLATFAVKKGLIISLVVFIIHNLFSLTASGQSEKLSDNITSIAEDLASDETDPEAASMFTDKLHELSENPVRINTGIEDEISRLFFLSDFQVKALKDYVTSSGPILTIFEIANIPGFDKEAAEMITPFITLENKSEIHSDSVRFGNSLISNFSIKPGSIDSSNLGSNWRILTRYKFTSRGFSGGLTMEKDPGEKFLTGHPALPDFFSGYMAWKGKGIVRNLIIGDFSARFGQGSNINTGMRRGISLISPGYMSASDEIKPYTSSDENRFFRGLATELSIRNFGLSLFISKNYIDTSLDSLSGTSVVKSFYQGGIHNTKSLLNKKDNIAEIAYGLNLTYNINNLKLGFTWSQITLSFPVNEGRDPENLFEFNGIHNPIYSLYYNTFIKKILFYGEFSVNTPRKYAVIQGISLRPSDRLTINVLMRSYNAGFTSFYGQAPGSSSKSENEKGILANFSFEALKHLFINGGCDVHNFPWLKYRCSAPTHGVKKEIKITFIPSEKLGFDATYSYNLAMVDNSQSVGIPDQNQVITRSFKASARYAPHEKLILGTRIDLKLADPSGSKGYAISEDINYSFKKIPVTIWIRYCLFNTDDWSSRIYNYENDLLYSFSIPALSGEGSRNYVMVKCKISRLSEVRVKYGLTDLIAKGISMETDEIKMQFRIWF